MTPSSPESMDGEPDRPSPRGIARLLKATGYSLAGLKYAWCREAAFRQEAVVIVFLLPAGCWLGGNAVERSLLVGSCLLVLMIELLNSALEALCDRVGMENHDLVKAAKDMGSAAVMLSLTGAVLVWAVVLFERYWPGD